VSFLDKTLKRRRELSFVLIYLYIIFLTFGSCQRFFENPFGAGITSILGVIVILLLFRETVSSIMTHKILQLWLILIVYIFAIVKIIDQNLILDNSVYFKIVSLLFYLLLCSAISSMPWDALCIRNLGYVMVAGLGIMGIFAVLDDFKVVAIPFINLCLMFDPPYKDPLAQFGHRSIMSLYLGLMLPFLFVLEDRKERLWFKITTIAVGIIFIYFLVYSGNRSGIAAIMISLVAYYSFNVCNRDRLLNRYIPSFVFIVIMAFVLVFFFRPVQGKYFLLLWSNSPFMSWQIRNTETLMQSPLKNALERYGTLSEIHRHNLYRSDLIRVEVARDVVEGIVKYPVGRGFMLNTHVHFMLDIIYAAGIFGIIWIIALIHEFTKTIMNIKKSLNKIMLWALLTPLISWFFVSIMYNALHLSLPWIYLGVILSMNNQKEGVSP
jgi:hypothetical protein